MSEYNRLGKFGFTYVEAYSPKELEDKVDNFLDSNATVQDVKDIKIHEYMEQNPLNPQQGRIKLVAYISFYYDKAMNDRLVDESQTSLNLETIIKEQVCFL